MPTEDFDVDAALNRILNVVTPYRAGAHQATELQQVANLTSHAVSEATEALGVPLTQDVAMSLLFAAVMRLADIWNAENTTIEIPDSL